MSLVDFPAPTEERILITRLHNGDVIVDQGDMHDDIAISLCTQAIRIITDRVFGVDG